MPISFPTVVNADNLTSGTMPLERLPTQWVASDTLRHSNDTSRNITANGVYTKVKEIKINHAIKGTLRIKFDLTGGGGGTTAYCKIYKNGVAVGTEQTQASGTATKSEDLAITLDVGDLLQLYAYNNGVGTNSVSNFRIYGDPTTFVSIHTNQDP